MELIAGQKTKLSDLTTGQNGEEPVHVQVAFDLPDTDISVFGLDDERQLQDDRYMVFFNQPGSPQGEVQATFAPGAVAFTLRLETLPAAVTRLMFTATHDTRPLRDAGQLALSLGPARFDAVGTLHQEKAVMLAELYRHGNEWRLNTVGQGFDGGLAALVTYFGGEVAADEAAADEASSPSDRAVPAPAAPPPPRSVSQSNSVGP
ncbi:TerD family protein [Deinococcus sp. PESE-38]